MNKQPDSNERRKEELPTFRNRRELLLYSYLRIRETKKWWLLPILLLWIALGVVINIFAPGSVMPAIYSLIP
ncbi:MAG: DUF5989 family protein [Candidatus Alcyoniella australis]|nr:DUF5989 family protein [Candidatus Alcyoniella australis]